MLQSIVPIALFVSSIPLKYTGKNRKGTWNAVKEVIIKVLLVLTGSPHHTSVKWGPGNQKRLDDKSLEIST